MVFYRMRYLISPFKRLTVLQENNLERERERIIKSETEIGLECLCRINKQRELVVLDRQGTQEQSPESPTVTITWHTQGM